MKVEIDWSNILNENGIDVELSKHSIDRSHYRDGKTLDIKKQEIEKLVDKSSNILIKNWNRFQTFVIHGMKSKLNIVGALTKKTGKWVFKVITVMLKDTFEPRWTDKFIEVYEQKIDEETFYIYGEKKKLKTFEEFVNEKK